MKTALAVVLAVTALALVVEQAIEVLDPGVVEFTSLFNQQGGGWVVRRCPLSYSPGRPTVLAYSWARPAILVAGKGRGGCFYFFCFFTFISVPLSSLSLSFISSTISSFFSLSLGDDTK